MAGTSRPWTEAASTVSSSNSTFHQRPVRWRIPARRQPTRRREVHRDVRRLRQPAVQVTKGGRFNAGPSCADDLGDQNGPIQWIDWNYGSTFGSNTVSAEVFVKPDANPRTSRTAVPHLRQSR